MRTGTVSVVHGFGEADVNTLVDRNSLDPLTGMARLAAFAVTMTPV